MLDTIIFELEPENKIHLSSLLGEMNSNLRAIENNFQVEILNRGFSFQINGEKKNVNQAKVVILDIYAKLFNELNPDFDINFFDYLIVVFVSIIGYCCLVFAFLGQFLDFKGCLTFTVGFGLEGFLADFNSDFCLLDCLSHIVFKNNTVLFDLNGSFKGFLFSGQFRSCLFNFKN